MSKYDYEFEYDPVYCYPSSDVLRNKMDIRDQDRLSKIERDISFIKTTELMKKASGVSFTTGHLCLIHAFLFGNLYAWAGQIRTVDIPRGLLSVSTNMSCPISTRYSNRCPKRIFAPWTKINWRVPLHIISERSMQSIRSGKGTDAHSALLSIKLL